MTVAGISMVHNEQDVIGYVVRHMLAECDLVLVADNESTDATRLILDAMRQERLVVFDEPTDQFDQARVMMRLANEATVRGAEWVIPFDADEWWESPDGPIREVLAAQDGFQTRAMAMDMIPQPDDPPGPDPFLRLRWYRPFNPSQPENRKIAWKPGDGRRIMQGSHGLVGLPVAGYGPLRIRHLPYRSLEQAAAKLRHGRAALERSNQPEGSGWQWRQWGALDDNGLARWWAEWTNPEGLERLP